MLAVQIHAPPLRSLVGSPLQELARGIAEELRYIHLLGPSPPGRCFPSSAYGNAARPCRSILEEPIEEIVEQAPSAPERRAPPSTAPRLGGVDLAEVLGPRASSGHYAPRRDDRRPHTAHITKSRSHYFYLRLTFEIKN